MENKFFDEIIVREKGRRKKAEFLKEIEENGFPKEFFQTVCIGNGIARIKLPDFLREMPREWIEQRYTFEPEPQLVMANGNGSVVFSFSLLDVEISGDVLRENVCIARKGMQQFLPSAIFYEDGQVKVNEMDVCWYAYLYNTQDGKKTCNRVYYVAAPQVIVITMTCAYSLRQQWEAIIKYCIGTLKGMGCDG